MLQKSPKHYVQSSTNEGMDKQNEKGAKQDTKMNVDGLETRKNGMLKLGKDLDKKEMQLHVDNTINRVVTVAVEESKNAQATLDEIESKIQSKKVDNIIDKGNATEKVFKRGTGIGNRENNTTTSVNVVHNKTATVSQVNKGSINGSDKNYDHNGEKLVKHHGGVTIGKGNQTETSVSKANSSEAGIANASIVETNKKSHNEEVATDHLAKDNYKNSSREANMALFNHIQNSSLFRHFRIAGRDKRETVTLLVVVSSAPKRTDRRNAIRQTWWQMCNNTDMVHIRCLFITDKQTSNSQYVEAINEESQKYHDLEFQDLGGGVEFGKRYLYHMLWAVRNFEFDYFLRLDDDYFLCMDKVINELPMPPLKMFHWGWVHCINGITRPEESVLLFSKDVIEKFLMQNPETMRCHPWADQQIGLWVEDLGLQKKLHYRHDNRLHHDPPTRDLPYLLAEKDVCKGHIGLHGSYPETMRTLWQHRGTYELKDETLEQNSQICKSDLQFSWKELKEQWMYEPKLCHTNPTWNTTKQESSRQSYGGREDGRE
eukprot:gene17034-18748_t